MRIPLVVLALLITSACSLHQEPAVWRINIADGMPFGGMRQTRPDEVHRATETYKQFLTELDARYFEEVDLAEVTLNAMQGALARLNAHGEVLRMEAPPPCQSELGVGAIIVRDYHNNIIISSLAPTSPLVNAGIHAGTRLLAVDGLSTNLRTSSEISELIVCNGKLAVNLTVEQDGIVRTTEIIKQKNEFPTIISTLLPGNIRYLWISEFGEFGNASRAIAELERARTDGSRGIILDLRSMTGGYLAAGKIFLTMLVPASSTMLWYNNSPVTLPDLRTPLTQPLVVLTNGRTASLGEILALALKELGRAIIIGEQTSGFGTALGEIMLPDQSTAYIPHVIYLGPKQTSIEGVGVMPDIIVRDTSPYGYFHDGIPDAILATALAHLQGERLQYAQAP